MSDGMHVDYDAIASTYDRRYVADTMAAVGSALADLAQRIGTCRVLEVGCGTGHWLIQLADQVPSVVGIDRSAGMLHQARARAPSLAFVQGIAEQLPCRAESVDLVFCVNALHHFDRPRAFLGEAYRLLRPGGLIAIVSTDPHGRRAGWYLYDYFAGTYASDLCRFPSWPTLLRCLKGAQFVRRDCRLVVEIDEHRTGRQVLEDPFLEKGACSQLALLSDTAYAAGLARIHAALDAVQDLETAPVFDTDLRLALITAWKPGRESD